MHRDLIRDTAKEFPALADPLAIRSLRVWHCKYKSLDPIQELKNLQALKIASFPDGSFEALAALQQLEWLSVLHMPKVTSLEAIGRLGKLRFLSLETLPSWDSSRKRTIADSLNPIADLPLLAHVSLLGVVPADQSLDVLTSSRHLRSAKFHGFPKSTVERFFEASGAQDAHMPEWPLDTP